MATLTHGIGHASVLIIVSSLTFGRDSAQYWQLIAVLAIISIVLWIFVFITTILRIGARYIWYRPHSRTVIDKDLSRQAAAEL
jgi:hypothetical protein